MRWPRGTKGGRIRVRHDALTTHCHQCRTVGLAPYRTIRTARRHSHRQQHPVPAMARPSPPIPSPRGNCVFTRTNMEKRGRRAGRGPRRAGEVGVRSNAASHQGEGREEEGCTGMMCEFRTCPQTMRAHEPRASVDLVTLLSRPNHAVSRGPRGLSHGMKQLGKSHCKSILTPDPIL